jgi:hypothetical protein
MLNLFYSTSKYWLETTIFNKFGMIMDIKPGKTEMYQANGDIMLVYCMSGLSDPELTRLANELVDRMRRALEHSDDFRIYNSDEVLRTLRILVTTASAARGANHC